MANNSNGGGGADEGGSPEYGETSDSPQYGEGFTESSQTTSQDEDLRTDMDHRTDVDHRTDMDHRTDTDLRPHDTDLRSGNQATTGAGGDVDSVKAKRTRWSNGDKENSNPTSQESLPETNGPSSDIFPAASQDIASSAAVNANQTEVAEG
jgi:hypothetical protein